MIQCPLCGRKFEESESRSLCSGCGKSGCGLVKCPGCGYEFPPDTLETRKGTFGAFVKKIFNKE